MRFVQAAALVSAVICSDAALSQEVVTNEPLRKDQIIGTLPVLALRKLPVDKVISPANNPNYEWMVSYPAVVKAALTSEKLPEPTKSIFKGLDSSDPTVSPSTKKIAFDKAVELWTSGMPENLKNTYLGDHIDGKSKLLSYVPSATDTTTDKLTSITFDDGSTAQVDANAVGRILASNKIIQSGEKRAGAAATPADLNLNTYFANDIQATYYPLKVVAGVKTDTENLAAINTAIQQASYDLPVAAAVLINEGEAGFGRPLPYTSKDKSLSVAPTLARRYDIYWVELAVSPSEELIQNIVELRYDFAIKGIDALALDLQPARIGVETSIEGTAKTPTVKVGEVEVGEMFSRTIQYKYIRPTILAHGVLTSSLGWIFTGESLDASTKRMFAVIGVPKGSKQISATLALAAKCKRYLGLESWWATTGPIPQTIKLP